MMKLLAVVCFLTAEVSSFSDENFKDIDFSLPFEDEEKIKLWNATFGVDLTNLPTISSVGMKQAAELMTYVEAYEYCKSFGEPDMDEYQLPVTCSIILVSSL